MATRFITLVMALIVVLGGCVNRQAAEHDGGTQAFQYDRWTVSDPVFAPGPSGQFDDVAVKDPAIVRYEGKYHLFYTSKAATETRGTLDHVGNHGSGLGYVAAPTLEELDDAQRYDMNEILGEVVIAVQVFYFEPQDLWYLVGQTPIETESKLAMIYLTNPDISDPYGWSEPVVLDDRRDNGEFWIDFWIIGDDEKAHLFYTDHADGLFRRETPLENFPDGLADAEEIEVLRITGETEEGPWRLHEASHIYYVEETGEYLNLMEAVYPHPTRPNYWDSRNRFMFAMIADSLEGPWRRVEREHNEFAGDPANLYRPDGTPSDYDQVSHFELIRPGYDQRLAIDDYRLDLLFQAFDADETPDGYDYNLLPWELAIMRNY